MGIGRTHINGRKGNFISEMIRMSKQIISDNYSHVGGMQQFLDALIAMFLLTLQLLPHNLDSIKNTHNTFGTGQTEEHVLC